MQGESGRRLIKMKFTNMVKESFKIDVYGEASGDGIKVTPLAD